MLPVQLLSSIDSIKSISSLRKDGTLDSSIASQLGIAEVDTVDVVGSHHPFGGLISTSTHSFSKLCKFPSGAE